MNRREIVLGAAALAACAPAAGQAAPPFPMRRGVNLGNALEAPNEGDWGYRIEDDHIAAIADAGFDGIRVPARWHADARGAVAPYFLARVAAIVDQGLALGLKVQLDCHHYDALIATPERERAKFLRMWRAVATHFRDAPKGLIFEPLNEPNGVRWRGRFLSDLQREVIGVIRESNPARAIVLGPGNWQNIDALDAWRPPVGDELAASVHYYEPRAFTHERAEWLGAEAPTFGRTWGSDADRAQIHAHIETAARWGREHGVAMQLGEFGAIGTLPLQQRADWTREVRQACEAQGMGWCVWDFAGAFPIWDAEAHRFIPELRAALLDQ